ncbi:MAG: DUF4258 domain-containing protein [Actinobacteria bacterium]|nr:DUF4258 domain-containing protein [Actinomycetota bacterium]MBU4217806.1 DUF4258 domain-containing protein [Actinomycetota bacterium]MBU4359512.1 DUF4258 domain-containing protein [Actinomycetota bacterium]MBU4390999.1 DUF4258 domain-containing protein [Actinomycetota bacterium]MBU4403589.1 DUF4258 domain-containing protein [Actinomycetota bacterium]
MVLKPLVFRVHAIQRMYKRRISIENVRHVIATGEVVEEYPNDLPYPSRLLIGWCGSRPIHVVVADNKEAREVIVITVYEPDPTQWEMGFERRKQ